MRILVTNDDGIGAVGLAALAETLGRDHDVCIFAPDKERSGVSHALTLGTADKIRKVGEKAFSCSGTPADCVLLCLLGAIGFVPQIVVSGINKGSNLGTDIIYSGTCAAAREAVLSGIPGIAVSCVSRSGPFLYGAAANFVLRNLDALVDAGSGQAFINVNAPSSDSYLGHALWSIPCTRVYGNELKSFDGPDGFSYCFLTGGYPEVNPEVDSDYAAVSAGRISVSPVLVHPQVPADFLPGRDFS